MSIQHFSSIYPNVVFRSKVRTTFQAHTSHALDKHFTHLFDNQVIFGKSIFNAFLDRSLHTVLAVALTQSGKTGSMLSVIYHFISSPSLAIPLRNVFIITGHSSTEWLEQTKERFPTSMHSNIYHRNGLAHFSKKIRYMTNILILIDETQIASYANQTIQSALRAAGINEQTLYFRDIKFVLVSATPNSCVKRFIPKRDGYDLVYMMPAPGYRSIFEFYDSGALRQCKDLCGFDPASNSVLPFVYDNIREIPLGLVPKYHIIRTHHSFKHDLTLENFRHVFRSKCSYLSMPDLTILSIPPSAHTFIFIKETLRCAKTIDKTYVGVLYERYSRKVSDSSIIQGLAGRATGYHSRPLIIFTNLPSIERYRLLWDNQFNPDLSWTNYKPSWNI
jgi:hypothetical protein